MTTPIDLEDVRKSPQDYLIDGIDIKCIQTRAYWIDKDSFTQSYMLGLLFAENRITRKPKKRKIKVRPYLDIKGAIDVYVDEGRTVSGFVDWAGPEQEIEVTE